MKVWIENPFDNLPIEGFRPQRFWLMAQAFAAAGHDVTLWTSDFNHTTKGPRGEGRGKREEGRGEREAFRPLRGNVHPDKFYSQTVKLSNRQTVKRTYREEGRGEKEFELVMVPSIPYFSNVSVRRMFSHWRYAHTWEKMAREYASKNGAPDVIIVSTPPLSTGAAARKMAGDYGARLVFDVMDAWPETFERIAPRWALAPLRRLAKANYLSANLITTVADRYIQLVRSYGYTGTALRFFHGIAVSSDAVEREGRRSPGAIRLAYIGNLGRTYDLPTVIDALHLLPSATLEVAGLGAQEDFIRRQAAENPRIVFHGYLGENEMKALLARCDIGIVPMAPESCVGVPYKLADYSRAGLAIASSLGGESGTLLERYGAGIGYRAGDARDLANAIAKISTSLDAYCAAARKMAETEFSASAIYPAYVRAVEAL